MDRGKAAQAAMPETADLVRRLDEELAALIEKYHAIPAVSLSSYRATRTGNGYQSLKLRDRTLKGFRAADSQIYEGLPLEGLSLVDLGCNTGEKTRYAADAGASFAEGIEYEELFVRIGNLVNAYNRYGNVVLRQGDITRPGLLKRRYDVAASFSSFVYLKDTLPEILSWVDRMFICETHALTERWYPRYVTPVTGEFPYWLLYGFTDHGGSHAQGRRALLLFARDRALLSKTIFGRAASLAVDNASICEIDMEASPLLATLVGKAPAVRDAVLRLRERLAGLPAGDVDGVVSSLASAAERMEASGAAAAPERFASDSYWCAMFKGIVDYRARGTVALDNPFLQLLRRMAQAGLLDMKDVFLDDTRGPKRLKERLDGFLAMLVERRSRSHFIAFNPSPLDLLPENAGINPSHKITGTDGRIYTFQSFDGYHRLAACWLCGVPSCTVYFCWTNIFGLATRNYASFGPEADAAAQPARDRLVESVIDAAVLRFALPGGVAGGGADA